jgi:sodium-dependent dicarboxylate transporter 2/3/5
MNIRQKTGLTLAVFVLLATLIVPIPEGLTMEGRNTIGLALFFLILLVTEALPLSVSCLVTIGLTPLWGVTEKFAGAVTGFAHPVVFFIIASFGIAGAIMNVPITKRILTALLSRFGQSIESILLAMMIVTAALSFFMSNVPTCAIMMSIALEFINLFEEGDEKRSIGKAFMIAIPVATMIGGMSTPASSSLNLLAIGLLEQYTGDTITFVQWMAAGIPMAVVFIPFAWFLIIKVYKPANIDAAKINLYIEKIRVKEKADKKELYVIAIMAGMLTLWIASSWFRSIEVFTVAILGCSLFFMPGINVLTWKEFVAGINWDIIFISGTVLSTANALVENNVSDWMANSLFPELVLGQHMLTGLAALSAFSLLLLITSAPALITVLAGPFTAIAIANGCPPAYLIIALAFCAGNCYLFPLDTVQLLTYSKGYYRMTDMGKSTVYLQIAMVIVLALWLPFIGGMLGL